MNRRLFGLILPFLVILKTRILYKLYDMIPYYSLCNPETGDEKQDHVLWILVTLKGSLTLQKTISIGPGKEGVDSNTITPQNPLPGISLSPIPTSSLSDSIIFRACKAGWVSGDSSCPDLHIDVFVRTCYFKALESPTTCVPPRSSSYMCLSRTFQVRGTGYETGCVEKVD